jgi:hypothetical protein
MIPDIRLAAVKPDGEGWVQIRDPGKMKGRIACDFIPEGSLSSSTAISMPWWKV